MKVKDISMIWVSVSDVKKAKAFFTDVIGLKVMSSSEEHGWVELGGHDGGALFGIGECQQESPVMPGQNAVITFTVDNIEQVKEAMLAKGVKLLGDIIEVPGHVKMLFFTDQDNNKFQFVEVVDTQELA